MAPELKRTPLFEAHRRHGARLVDFGGWEMPVQYPTGVLKEHAAVRGAAGLFDVSHMGEMEVRGPRALEAVQGFVSNDAAALGDGQAMYTVVCLPSGGIVDDVLVYRYAADRFFFCLNAGNQEKDFAWIRDRVGTVADCVYRSDEFAQVALQGRLAPEILQRLTRADLAGLRYYWFTETEVAGVPAVVARTGYTGEDGFEVFVSPAQAQRLWDALLEEGGPKGLVPVGLAARDTLRLEMKFALYGNDIDETTSPLEAGLGWVVKLDKGPFVGSDVLARQKAAGVGRRLVGFELVDRAVPRHGYACLADGGAVGTVTSGTLSPSLDKPIGMAYLPSRLAAVGSRFVVDVRGKPREAVVVKTPFYRRPY
ncbi:MAG: glycine cleavage system aminomethyltransferase GcvT [Phycisphaerae bacterium]|nr:glycine cleavage system aminomethyltransferase GcvT [Phycisphaerae bacterium]